LEGWGDGEVVRAYSGEEAGNNPYTEEAGQPSTYALCWANIAAWGGYSSMHLKGQQGGVATAAVLNQSKRGETGREGKVERNSLATAVA
jgi:hypothetical protein